DAHRGVQAGTARGVVRGAARAADGNRPCRGTLRRNPGGDGADFGKEIEVVEDRGDGYGVDVHAGDADLTVRRAGSPPGNAARGAERAEVDDPDLCGEVAVEPPSAEDLERRVGVVVDRKRARRGVDD